MPRPLERIFSGHWRIVGVAVTDGPVQALVADDPAYLHRTLTFSADRLAWDEPANTTEAACLAPTFTHHSAEPDPEQALQLRGLQIHHPVAYTVRCRSGDWGPAGADDPTFFVSDGGSLALPWYDGGMLKLMRAK